MKPWTLLLISLLALPAPPLAAAEPPVRLALRTPDAPLQPGKASRLVVELLAEDGRPARAVRAVAVELAGAAKLGAPRRAVVPAGASRVEVPIRAPKAGLWQLAAHSRGLFSGFGVVVCLEKAPVPARPGRPATRPRERPAPAPPPLPPPLPPGGAPSAMILHPAAHGAPQGQVRLIVHPTRVPRTRDGWESLVDAFWFEGDVPALRSTPLDGFLVLAGGSSVAASSERIRIPGGQFKADVPTKISARREDSTEVQALYLGGKSKPVRIDFVSPPPAQLALAGASRGFRGLTGVTSDVLVRLLDDDGEPAAADREISVTVAVEGPLGTRTEKATVPAGAMQGTAMLDLNRPGRYTVQASAPGLKSSDPVEVRFDFDWLLIACSLIGGVLGSLTRVLYRRERRGAKGLLRAVVLGVAAALFVLLLSAFGVLSVLGDALPAAEALGKVPATSLLGALLLGFLAGLIFDKIFGQFLGGRGGRRPKPPAAAAQGAKA